MKVSVLLITYNHEPYIRQCLEGIALQRLAGSGTGDRVIEMEIILADDCSGDATVRIIRESAGMLQVPVSILPGERNLGFVKNYQRAFSACGGDYIAVIEGDDYWTDPDRLIKHVDFLEEHRESVLSMNRFVMYNETSQVFTTAEWQSSGAYENVTTGQLILHNKLGNLSACVFRASAIAALKPDLFDLEIADWMIGIVMSRNGSVSILKECMSVYRVHEKGQWSQMSPKEQLAKVIELSDIYDRYLEGEYAADFALHKKNLEALMHPPPQTGYTRLINRMRRLFHYFIGIDKGSSQQG